MSYKDTDFALRMFQYYYRVFDLYNKPIASLAIFADPDIDFRPSSFEIHAFDKRFLLFEFEIAKILDWTGKEKNLENDNNPFAIVTLASLKTYEQDTEKRFGSKYHLTKMLYEREYSGEMILALYEFLDGIMVLPDEMENEYNEKMHTYEKEKKVAYITTAERIGSQKRAQKDILEVLEARFGEISEDITSYVNSIVDDEMLSSLVRKAAIVESLEDFTRELSS